MGADVTVTEMSRPSLELLRRRFAHNSKVSLVYDPEGHALFASDQTYDLILCVSVLHHIPDYERFVRRAAEKLVPGGAFASFQDPLWYPRRNRMDVRFDRAAYFAWRLRQGNIARGLATRVRRARGVYDETNPADMVEYHVVRQGVDEQLLLDIMNPRFADVTLWRYFSTQGRWLQSIGQRLAPPTTFALIATDRRPDPTQRPRDSHPQV
jgi:SAM-dependent methyltransferase